MVKYKKFIGESAEKMLTRFIKDEMPIISGLFKSNLPGTINYEIDLIYE